jgi:hypothetical protein
MTRRPRRGCIKESTERRDIHCPGDSATHSWYLWYSSTWREWKDLSSCQSFLPKTWVSPTYKLDDSAEILRIQTCTSSTLYIFWIFVLYVGNKTTEDGNERMQLRVLWPNPHKRIFVANAIFFWVVVLLTTITNKNIVCDDNRILLEVPTN